MKNDNINQVTGSSNQDSQVNNSNEGNQIDWWKIHDKEYIHYFYKITNKINGMFYYGIHSLLKSHNKKPEEDGYWGSGADIKKAIKEFGIENFSKEIIEVFQTRLEVKKKEEEVVTIELVESSQCYNKVVGGGENILGKVCVTLKNTPGKTILIDREEYYNNLDKYKTHSNNRLVVKFRNDTKNDWFVITTEEYYENKDKYELPFSKVSEGKIVVTKKGDKERKAVWMDKNDPRYLSGEYIGITKGIKLTPEAINKRRGSRNGSFGSMWITDGNESKKIYDNIIPEGWKKGRVMSSEARKNMNASNHKKGNIKVYNKLIIKPQFNEEDFNADFSLKKEKLKELYNQYKTWKKLSLELKIEPKHIRRLRKSYEKEGFKF